MDQADAIGDPSLMDNQAQVTSTEQLDEDRAARSLSLETANQETLSDTADDISVQERLLSMVLMRSVLERQLLRRNRPGHWDRISSVLPLMEAKLQSSEQSSIRVDVTLLDELMDFAGELVLARNTLNRCSDDLLDPGYRELQIESVK